ncbi:MAG: hypothetical protein MJZ29_06730 [Bacteroidaceae bacterium]|nr:hypothetical protein [Bacteroidaceae bacterium]
MKNYLNYIVLAFAMLLSSSVQAQNANNLTVKMRIDDTYAFAFDLTESRSAKGGIWNVKTGEAVTPLNYSEAKTDTIDGKPVVKLYRQVALGNHPLNGWETWVMDSSKWVRMDETTTATTAATKCTSVKKTKKTKKSNKSKRRK